jgi:hypothetical protein
MAVHLRDPSNGQLYVEVPAENAARLSLTAASHFLHRAVYVSKHYSYLLKICLCLGYGPLVFGRQ